MANNQPSLSTLEQNLLRFAMANDGRFAISAAQLRQAITTGSVDAPGKGPFSKSTALLEILEVKERLTGVSLPEEVGLARQIVEAKLAQVKGSLGN
jgi:hypothetical protein